MPIAMSAAELGAREFEAALERGGGAGGGRGGRVTPPELEEEEEAIRAELQVR